MDFPFIPVAEPSLAGNELKYVQDCIESTWISSSGAYLNKFEQNFSAYCGASFGLAVSNGTVALHLALMAIGIQPGDEVIVPTLTFAASVNSIIHAGGKPVLVDIDPKTWNMDPTEVERHVTARTKAIMVVHLYGNPCDMRELNKIKEKYNLHIIEDAAEAHGAMYHGSKVGSFGDISCFSFFGNKVITTGEGGMCLTSDRNLYEKMLVLRDHGMDRNKRYWHNVVGYNYRLTNLQAAIGVAQIERMDEIIARRLEIAERYKAQLLPDRFEYQLVPPNSKSIHWLFSLLLPDTIDRDDLMRRLKEQNIDSRPFFYPMHLMPPYRINKSFVHAERVASRGINLPSSMNLTDQHVDYISEVLNFIID